MNKVGCVIAHFKWFVIAHIINVNQTIILSTIRTRAQRFLMSTGHGNT